jgi:hypothetical protein
MWKGSYPRSRTLLSGTTLALAIAARLAGSKERVAGNTFHPMLCVTSYRDHSWASLVANARGQLVARRSCTERCRR